MDKDFLGPSQILCKYLQYAGWSLNILKGSGFNSSNTVAAEIPWITEINGIIYFIRTLIIIIIIIIIIIMK